MTSLQIQKFVRRRGEENFSSYRGEKKKEGEGEEKREISPMALEERKKGICRWVQKGEGGEKKKRDYVVRCMFPVEKKREGGRLVLPRKGEKKKRSTLQLRPPTWRKRREAAGFRP